LYEDRRLPFANLTGVTGPQRGYYKQNERVLPRDSSKIGYIARIINSLFLGFEGSYYYHDTSMTLLLNFELLGPK